MKIEYRITGSGAGYETLADDSPATGAPQIISGYKPGLRASPQIEPLAVAPGDALASFIYGRSGHISVNFAVDRQHGTADAALSFLQQHLLAFCVSGTFDLKITVNSSMVYLPACAIASVEPDEHSDQHTFVRYSFTGSTYTDSDPG